MKFSIEHARLCPKGGFPSIRHNEIRDLTANLLTEVCNDVCIEPELLPIDGELFTGTSLYSQNGARLDFAANGFWGGRFERAFFDVRVFNPHAPSNRHPCCYRKHELEKKQHYEQRVREVEHASFTPLVLSATGGMANEATVFYAWPPNGINPTAQQCPGFDADLLQSAIQCIRGAHSSCGHALKLPTPSMDLVVSELDFVVPRQMIVVFGLGTGLHVRLRITLENRILRNGQQPQSVVNGIYRQR